MRSTYARRLRALVRTIPVLLVVGLAGIAAGFSQRAAAADFAPGCTSGIGDAAALTQAIEQANGNGQSDTITLQPGCTYTLSIPLTDPSRQDGLLQVLPDGGNALTIAGNGATIARAARTGPRRLFDVASGARLTLLDLTLTGGVARSGGALRNSGETVLRRVTLAQNGREQGGPGPSDNGEPGGAAVSNIGTLTVERSTIQNNATAGSGAIHSRGTLVIGETTIADNQADGEGGGVFASGSVRITSSTLARNTATRGGAILVAGGSWELANLTVTGNRARTGGGIALSLPNGGVTVNNSTIAGNSADGPPGQSSANIDVAAGTTLALGNTIVAEAGGAPNCRGALADRGGNLQHPGASCGNFAQGNPLLGALQDNGGRVFTREPASGSPAIGGGDNASCAPTDARGVPRPQPDGRDGPAHCDIGAVEAAPRQLGPTFTVTSTEDSAAPCLATYCTLRAALMAANARPNSGQLDQVRFAIGGAGPHTLAPTEPLPLVRDTLAIDGFSQPGASANTLAAGNNAVLRIMLDGRQAGAASSLVFDGPGANGSSVRGLAIGGFDDGRGLAGAAIDVRGASGVTIAGNFLGTDVAGRSALPNRVGVLVNGGATIGGPAPADRNLISGNRGAGLVFGASSAGNTVLGNYIGTLADASAPLPNGSHGILADGASDLRIGGEEPGASNVIAGNGGDGVRIGGVAARVSVRANGIFGNGGLGIDLGGDGATSDDTGDGDAGPNGLQNAPTITSAAEAPGATTIAGTLGSTPNARYTIDLYATPACDAGGRGEGLAYLGSATPATDGAGVAAWSAVVTQTGLAGAWITAIATDVNGNSSEFSTCAPVRTNDLWTSAQPLDLQPTGAPQTVGATASQHITRPFQERWYRFPVRPGSRVTLRVTSQPGTMVTLHRDVQRVYDALSQPQSAAASPANDLPGNFLPGNFLPGNFLPGNFLPGNFLPGNFLPGNFLPGNFLPGNFLPGNFLPGNFLPGNFLPGNFLPPGYLPGNFLPGNFLPGNFLPGNFLPGNFLPPGVTSEQYAGAAYRSLMAVSADPEATEQTIERNTWDLSEHMYVRVVGPANLAQPFTVTVEQVGGICETITPVPDGLAVIAGAQPAAGQRTTLIVWDRARFAANDPGGDVNALATRLADFAARPEINATVIDLSATEDGAPKYPRVALANQQADANPACSAAKNVVAREIREVIGGHRQANSMAADTTTLRYIVLVGNDGVVPFFRLPDNAGLGSENEYFPPVQDNSPSNASLRDNRVMGQDGYGARLEVWRGGFFLPVADLAVGRLVGRAADVTTVLDAYTSTGGVVTPGSALVTGYDFVADAATTVQSELRAGLNQPGCTTCVEPATLIQPAGKLPSDPSAWSADALRTQLLQQRNDLIFFNGHFDAGALLAADYSSALYATEIASAPASFANTLLFSLGCHSGYSIPPPDGISGVSPEPDWALAFARRGATYVAATGYAYGDTDLTDYGERLMVNLARELRTGSGPVPIGQALMIAKQRYLEQKAALSGMDEKTLTQFTLYGLPMLRVDMPGERLGIATPPSAVSTAVAVTSGPGASLGLMVGQPAPGTSGDPACPEICVRPATQRVDVPLTNLADNTTITTTFWRGPGGETATLPAEPVFPLGRYGAGVNGTVLRGVGFRGGSYVDRAAVVPYTSAPTTEASRAIGSYNTPTFYPVQNWSANQFGAPQLLAVPAQYRSSGPDALDGTARIYSALSFRLYYLPQNWNSAGSPIRNAALAPAPQIGRVEVRRNAGLVDVFVNVLNSGAAGVQEVWITYTDPAATAPRWQSVDLVPVAGDATLWRTASSLALPDTAVFMVQAAGGAGLVGLDTNGGQYYPVVPPPPAPTVPPAASSFADTAFPDNGAFGSSVTFSARLTSGGTPSAAGRRVWLALGSQGASGTTDANGVVHIRLRLAQQPGSYTGRLTFLGATDLARATANFHFVVTKDNTTLAISPASATAQVDQTTGIVAVLRDSAGRPIADRTVAFVADGPARFARTTKTGLDGRAVLGSVPWPAGSYTIVAYFGGTVPLPGGNQEFGDLFYNPSQSAAVRLELRPAGRAPVTSASVSGPTAPGCPADCFIGSATVTLTADQPDAVIRYSVNGGPQQIYRAPFTVTQQGTNTVTFFGTSAGGLVEETRTLIVKIGGIPTAPVLDNFSQKDGKLGAFWSASDQNGYRVVSQQVDVGAGGPLYWSRRPPEFGANQEAYLRLVALDPRGQHGLLLKIVNGNWTNGAIRVSYDAANARVTVEVVRNGTFVAAGTFPLAAQERPLPGSFLVARALADGTVRVYVNCRLVGTVDTTRVSGVGNFYANRSGRVGAWFQNAPGAVFDDFGGGSVAP
jgi:CSLREA domain-containing protein